VDTANWPTRRGGKEVDNQNKYKQVNTIDWTTRRGGKEVDN